MVASLTLSTFEVCRVFQVCILQLALSILSPFDAFDMKKLLIAFVLSLILAGTIGAYLSTPRVAADQRASSSMNGLHWRR